MQCSNLHNGRDAHQEFVRGWTGWGARPAIIGTVIGSAGVNAFAFAANTTTAVPRSRSIAAAGATSSAPMAESADARDAIGTLK